MDGQADGQADGQVDGLPREFGYLVLPQFSLLNLGAAMDPLRSANRMSGHRLHSWRALSADGRPVPALNGVDLVVNGSFGELDRIANLVVVAGIDARRYAVPAILARLRRLTRWGCRLGAVSTGSYILAKVGLLDGYRCTIHWENLNSFSEEFPNLEATQEPFEIDRMTCSGGTVAMACGFVSASHFSKCYRDFFKRTPREDRAVSG